MLNKTGATAMNIGTSGDAPFERTAVIGENGLVGVVETAVIPQLDVTVTDVSDINLSDITRINGDGTVIFRRAGGGKEYILNDAVCTGVAAITSGEGDTTLSFIGTSWTEKNTPTA
jgi:hypothetical protein